MVGPFAGSALLALEEYLSIKLPMSVAVTNLFYTVPSFCAGVAMYFIHAKYGLSRTYRSWMSCRTAVGCAYWIFADLVPPWRPIPLFTSVRRRRSR